MSDKPCAKALPPASAATERIKRLDLQKFKARCPRGVVRNANEITFVILKGATGVSGENLWGKQ
jgi:hypothetical protein